jgi:hypothetical protein
MPQEKFLMSDGNIHPTWKGFLSVLVTQLQQNLSNEGFTVPSQTNDNVTKLNNAKSLARILYNSTNNTFIGNVNGTFKTFTLT